MVTKKDKHLAAAQKYLERGSFEKALTEFQGAVKEDAKDTRTWLRMAEVYVRLGQNDKATEVYQKTVDLYVEQGFFQRAVAVYKNIIKLSPDFIEARIKLADVFRQLGLLSDAVQQLEQAATLFQRANRTPDALAAIKQMIDLNPEQPNPRIRYAELAAQTGAVKEAAAEFAEAAKLLRSQGRIEEFVRVAERVLHYEPDNHELGLEVAAKYLENNNPRAALSRIRPIFEVKQRDPQVLDILARTFEQLGQHHKTLPVLKELARVYGEAGRISERNQAAQRVLAMDPNDAEMQELLGRGRPNGAKAPEPRANPSPRPSVTPLPVAGSPKRPVNITFSEMEVPPALRNRYVALPADPLPASMSERINIASGMVEKSQGDAEVKRILAEADVFVKYGLVERAADHLRRVFERVPTHQGAHERLAAVLVQLDRKTEAAAEYETLAQQCQASRPDVAAGYARKALELNPSARRALEVLGATQGSLPETRAPSAESSISMELRMGTPEPEIIESDEIELLADGAEGEEFRETDTTSGGDKEGLPNPAAPEQADAAAFSAAPETVLSARLDEDHTHGKRGANLGFAEPPEVAAQAGDMPEATAEPDAGPGGDLAQIDFLIEQGVLDEATAMLDELEARFPGLPALAERRERLVVPQTPRTFSQGALPARPQAYAAEDQQAARGRGPGASPEPAAAGHDVETHADLGIMEKTMERFGPAIEHFKVLLADPKREVFALSMIGECHEGLGESAEAIRCYQDALKRPSATTAEATQLYYQLGNVFYNLGDKSEALYYFERVSKRDPSFRDVQQRLASVKAQASAR